MLKGTIFYGIIKKWILIDTVSGLKVEIEKILSNVNNLDNETYHISFEAELNCAFNATQHLGDL